MGLKMAARGKHVPRKRKELAKDKGKGKSVVEADDERGWFNDEYPQCDPKRLKKQAIAGGREVDIHSFEAVGLAAKFREIGWEKILEINTKCYDELVKEFYKNLIVQGVGEEIGAVSKVKGVQIKFDICTLGEILQISNEGAKVFWEPKKKFNDLINVDVTYRDIMLNYTGDTRRVKLRQLKPLPHAIAYIVQHNVVPRSGHHESLNSFEAYVTYCVHIGKKLNLLYIILKMMEYARLAPNRALPYGKLLTHIFNHYHIDLSAEDFEAGKKNKKKKKMKKNDSKISARNFHFGKPLGDVGAEGANVGAAVGEGVDQQDGARLSKFERDFAILRGDVRYIRRRLDQIAQKLQLSDLSEHSDGSDDSLNSMLNA